MTKKKDKSKNDETEDIGNNWLRGSIKYQRALKERLGDMFTDKQQRYLDALEATAKEENVKI